MKRFEQNQKYLGTNVKIIVFGEEQVVLNAMSSAYQEFARIQRTYSRFDVTSELSRFNNSPKGINISVSRELYGLVNYSLMLADRTSGLFDPTIIDLLETWGYKKSFEENNFQELERRNELQDKLKYILNNRKSYKDIGLTNISDEYAIKLQEGQRIDLGGVGKGFAIDRAFDILHSFGLEHFLIDAGGDIRVSGQNIQENRNWQVELWQHNNDSMSNKSKTIVYLESGDSICCSGKWMRQYQNFHHLLSPKTGSPATTNISHVFVLVKELNDWRDILPSQSCWKESFEYLNFSSKFPSTMIADSLATICFLNEITSTKLIEELTALGIIIQKQIFGIDDNLL